VVDNLRDKAAEKIKQMSGSGIRVKKSIKGRLMSLRKQSKASSKHGKPKKRKKQNNNISNKKRILDIFT